MLANAKYVKLVKLDIGLKLLKGNHFTVNVSRTVKLDNGLISLSFRDGAQRLVEFVKPDKTLILFNSNEVTIKWAKFFKLATD